MATTVPVSGLTARTLLASGDSIPFLAIADTTQSPGGSVDRITVANFFGATSRVPVPLLQGLGTLTGASKPALDSTATWNDGAVTFTHILANVTNTASASASKLLDLQVGGSTMFSVRKDGILTCTSEVKGMTSLYSTTTNTSVSTATWTDLLTASSRGHYLVTGEGAAVGNSYDVACFVINDGSSVFVRTLANGSLVQLQMSGSTLQYKQTGGGTITLVWRVLPLLS